MAKKTNRAKPKSPPRPARTADMPVESAVEATQPETPAPRAPRPTKQNRSQVASERLEDEYGYITGDLRRVFILAAVMFALLITLNLVFRFIG